jgi:isoleucyl-tRNA synthetase
VELDGESVELAAGEILVQTQPAPGLAVAADKVVTVGIDTAITPELRAEGLAREIVRRIQDMRKKAGFNIEDRISTWYQGSEELAGVLATWAEYVKSETLSTRLAEGEPEAGAYTEEQQVEGLAVTLSVKQNIGRG